MDNKMDINQEDFFVSTEGNVEKVQDSLYVQTDNNNAQGDVSGGDSGVLAVSGAKDPEQSGFRSRFAT